MLKTGDFSPLLSSVVMYLCATVRLVARLLIIGGIDGKP